MNIIPDLASALYEFIFPRPASLARLEAMSPGELVLHLPASEPLKDERIIVLFAYADKDVRELVWELKYRGNRAVARKLAAILVDILQTELAERALNENFSSPLLVPMPISDKRRRERGYNQCEILAEEMQKLDPNGALFTLAEHTLVKDRHTSPQTLTNTREDRLRNVQGTMRAAHPDHIAGKCIIVLDDVTTTGASFAEARRALKEAGARKILCLAVAH